MNQTQKWYAEAAILAKALPYMRKYAGKVFVIKLGGSTMAEKQTAKLTAADIVLLNQVGIKTVIVHGGGPKISEMLAKRKIQSGFRNGLRITDGKTLEVVEAVLDGLNRTIVRNIKQAGGKALSLCGKNADIITATKISTELGFVGKPKRINRDLLTGFLNQGLIPVVAPIGVGSPTKGRVGTATYNINADTVAGAIAASLGARRLILMTDIKGILDKKGELIATLTLAQGKSLLTDSLLITGGMTPKLETCLNAVEKGVRGAVIVDGRVNHALLLEIFTEHGVGTLVNA